MKAKFFTWDCDVNFKLYENLRLAILLTDPKDDSPIATASINLPDEELDEDAVFVKEYSENAGMVKTLQDANVITNEIVKTANSGFVTIDAYRMSEETKKQFQEVLNKIHKNEK